MRCPSSGAQSRVKRMETQEIASRSHKDPDYLEGELLDLEDAAPKSAAARSFTGGPEVQAPVVPKAPKRRKALMAVLGLAMAGGVYYGSYWWTEGRFLVSTDDAYVKADLSVISAKVAGNITAVPIKENAAVKAGDTLRPDRRSRLPDRRRCGAQQARHPGGDHPEAQAAGHRAGRGDRPGQGPGALLEGQFRPRHRGFRPRANAGAAGIRQRAAARSGARRPRSIPGGCKGGGGGAGFGRGQSHGAERAGPGGRRRARRAADER